MDCGILIPRRLFHFAFIKSVSLFWKRSTRTLVSKRTKTTFPANCFSTLNRCLVHVIGSIRPQNTFGCPSVMTTATTFWLEDVRSLTISAARHRAAAVLVDHGFRFRFVTTALKDTLSEVKSTVCITFREYVTSAVLVFAMSEMSRTYCRKIKSSLLDTEAD